MRWKDVLNADMKGVNLRPDDAKLRCVWRAASHLSKICVFHSVFRVLMALFLYHLFTCIAYFTPLLGSVIADSYIGRFKVILYVSIFYVFGHILLSLGAVHTLPTFLRFGLDYGGLLVIAICTGGIKPCVSAFAADQFDESQKEGRAQFFSFFYFAINAENIALRVAKCIGTALRKRCKRESKDENKDWLEYAMPEYTKEMIVSVRSFIDVAIIFMPLILFWALFDQQASTWVIQAQNMNCRVGNLTIMAEQMSFINPLLIIILVPLFEVIIYPFLKKYFNVTPLRKMAIGGIIASLSFVVAGIIQFGVNKTIPIVPQYNQISLWTVDQRNIINSTGSHFLLNGRDRIIESDEYSIGGQLIDMRNYGGKGLVIKKGNNESIVFPFDIEKPKRTMRIYLMVESSNKLYNGTIDAMNSEGEIFNSIQLKTSNTADSNSFFDIKLPIISDGQIHLRYGKDCDDKCENEMLEFGMGSVYIAHLRGTKIELMNVIESNGMNLLWTIPQYVLITMGEILISVTGLEFAYSQASTDMKSVLQIPTTCEIKAMWLLTVCLGNMIDMAISGSHIIHDPSLEFFLYAALMLAVMLVFILLATRYTYKNIVADETNKEVDESKSGINIHSQSTNDTPLEYPKSVLFILGCEFCERFSFYGMKALLTVYLVTEHHLSPSTAVLLYHLFSCIAYLSPLIGSIAADSFIIVHNNVFQTQFILDISDDTKLFFMYPSFMCSVTFFYHSERYPVLIIVCLILFNYLIYNCTGDNRSLFDFTGLIIIALSTGGIKPCVSAFAVDQFRDDQEKLRAQFFSFFYFSINGGALFAILITPILKSRISCFGASTCFPLAFGVPGILMLFALIIFSSGSRSYKKLPPSRSNVALQLISCAITAIRKKCNGEKTLMNGDWMSLASPQHSQLTIQSLRSFLSVSLVFAPIILFWALFDQKGSTWILLARKLNYRIGGLNVIPEQINFLNPLLILILVPIFEGIVYPLARKIVNVTPLRKMATGGILTAISFIMCGFIQLEADRDQPPILRQNQTILHYFDNESIFMDLSEGIYLFRIVERDTLSKSLKERGLNLTGENVEGRGMVLSRVQGRISFCSFGNIKTSDGSKLIFMNDISNMTIHSSASLIINRSFKMCESLNLPSTPGDITVEWTCSKNIQCKSESIATGIGSVQAIQTHDDQLKTKTLVESNQLSIGWMFPQYVVITMGEVMLSVTGMEFACSQSTPSIRSLMQALWLMTVFLGNALDAIISGSHFVSSAASEFFFYASLMLLVMVFFIISAANYTYRPEMKNEITENVEMSETK
ncbi:pept-3 [Pristionchus pacificus]|uniref:Pept-3 n=1 Tax=Pristionchus pacificus TaxID=54126 RepID=A0A2A6BM39_PRIPA|nr:pept-3 [Pristionchus pacificus]|eukprot:PDM67002.1 pept-3 [Pristionchus pacificus]